LQTSSTVCAAPAATKGDPIAYCAASSTGRVFKFVLFALGLKNEFVGCIVSICSCK
jgi:hypothetical protein